MTVSTREKSSLIWCARSLIIFFWMSVIGVLLLSSRLTFFMPQRSITVLTWSETFDRALVKKFEQETGIKVYLSFYTSNEELLVKMRAGKGTGYDLILPSDYAVERLIDEGLLKKIDMASIIDKRLLNPRLMGLPFDPQNEYAVPFVCELLAVAFDKRKGLTFRPSNPYELIFRKPAGLPYYKVVMTNDPLEAFCLASYYLWGTVASLTRTQQKQVCALLRAQRDWVEAYAMVRGDYFLITGCADAALMQSAEIWRAMRSYPFIGIALSSEPFISIEHCALPIGTKKDELVYSFLRYMYSAEAVQEQYDVFSIIPARTDVIETFAVPEPQKEVLRLSPTLFKKFFFIRDILSEEDRINLWVALKA